MANLWNLVSMIAVLACQGPEGGDAQKLPPAYRLHFRLAQPVAAPGLAEMSRSPGPPVFVGTEDLFGAAEILSVGDSSSNAIDLNVSADVVAWLRATSPDRIAILEDDRLAGVADLEFPEAGGAWNLKLSGLGVVEASRLSWMLSEEANTRLAVSMAIVVPTDVQSAGSVVEAAVYLIGAKSIGAYQFVVGVSTPKRGWMRRDEMLIDAGREDYVFRGLSPRTRIDPMTGVLGATADPDGATPMGKAVYLGTVRLRTSADARGTFTAYIKRCPDTFVKDTSGVSVLFNHGSAVMRLREPVFPRLEK